MFLNQITAISFASILSLDAWSVAKQMAKRIADSVQEINQFELQPNKHQDRLCDRRAPIKELREEILRSTQSPAKSPSKTDPEVQKNWDETARQWNEFVGEDGKKDPNRVLSDGVLMELLGPVDGKIILDIGCGNGYLSRRLVSEARVFSVTAIDLSPEMIEIAKERTTDPKYSNIIFQVASGSNLPSNILVDHVVSNYVLMDCADLEANIASMYRVLKPGGTAVIVIVHPCFPLKDQDQRNGRLIFVWENSYFVRHEQEIPPFHDIFRRPFLIFHRSLEEYQKVFRDAGFEIKDIREPHPENLDGKAVSVAFLLKKPFRRELGPIKPMAPVARTEPMNIQIFSQHGRIDDLGKRLVRQQVPALQWQLECRDSKSMDWEEAKKYASEQRNGWRLPEIEELWALYEQRSVLGKDLDTTPYWSDTPSDRETTLWEMNFEKGIAGRRPITGARKVRCVRDVFVDKDE